MKPGNIVVDMADEKVFIADWGSSSFHYPNTGRGTYFGTYMYKAPELVLGYRYFDYKIDIWAVGTIMASLIFQVCKSNKQSIGWLVVDYIQYGSHKDKLITPFVLSKKEKVRCARFCHFCAILIFFLGVQKKPMFNADTDEQQFLRLLTFAGSRKIDELITLKRLHPSRWQSKQMMMRQFPGLTWSDYVTETNFEFQSPEAWDLLDHLLVVNPDNRYTAREALAHPYFDPIRECLVEIPKPNWGLATEARGVDQPASIQGSRMRPISD
jgi:serine/threonine protein kinase